MTPDPGGPHPYRRRIAKVEPVEPSGFDPKAEWNRITLECGHWCIGIGAVSKIDPEGVICQQCAVNAGANQ